MSLAKGDHSMDKTQMVVVTLAPAGMSLLDQALRVEVEIITIDERPKAESLREGNVDPSFDRGFGAGWPPNRHFQSDWIG